jgi:hypothetical protein
MPEAAVAISKDAPEPVSVPPAPADHHDRYHSSSSSRQKRPNTVNGKSGVWYLGKTIGAGSMGKVKIAKLLETSETVSFYSSAFMFSICSHNEQFLSSLLTRKQPY